jgi:hypothetical protein
MAKTLAPITSDRALAKALGVTHTTIAVWRQKFAGDVPESRDLAAWKAFVEEQGLGTANNRASKDREHWLTRSAAARARLLEMEEERQRGETIRRADVDAVHLHVATRQRTILIQHLETELAPKLEGLSASAMRPVLRQTVDAICDVMSELAGELEKRLREAKA